MSSPPTKYIKSFDYAANPTLNVDFDRLKVTTDQTIDRLALIQRDDGALRDGAITESSLADGAVSTAKLKDGAVTEPKLANLSVSNRTLLDLAVTTSKIALLAVGTGQLADMSVLQAKLGLLSVGTPQLIDAAVTSPKLGPSLNFTGVPTAPTAITGTNTTQLATTAFVAASMSAAGMITEAPNDGQLYGRHSLGWQRGVALAGDTMTGLLVLSADPAAPLGAATRQYVDAVQTLATGKVSKAGDTMTGNLAIKATLPAWSANYSVLGIGASGAFAADDTVNTVMASNLYSDGAAWRLKIAGLGGLYVNSGGLHSWYSAPTGAAGSAPVLAERMRLDAAGNLGLGVAPKAWNAGLPSFSLGLGAAIAGSTNNGQITIYSNLWHDGAVYRYITADGGSLYQGNSGQHNWFTAPAGAAGAVATISQRMGINSAGMLFANTNFGACAYNTKANRPPNVAFDMFSIPREMTNLANGITIKLTVVVDDTNSGYAGYYSEVFCISTVFAGGGQAPTLATVGGQSCSVNTGVMTVGCNTALINSGADLIVRLTPTTTGATPALTMRVAAQIWITGVDGDKSITRL